MTPNAIIPHKIAPGANVAVIAPAGRIGSSDYAAGLRLLRQRYRVIYEQLGYGPDEKNSAVPQYLSDTDDNRAAGLIHGLRTTDIDAIFCARGGYGCSRLLAHCNIEELVTRFSQRRIPLIGFSDVTALHSVLNRAGVVSIHGPVVTQLAKLPSQQLTHLFSLLENQHALRFDNLVSVTGGRCTGPVIGGNLTLLSHLIGTPLAPKFSGAILLIEEIFESPYRIDRLLTQLQLAGVFDQVAGVALGHFLTDVVNISTATGNDPEIDQVLLEVLGRLKIPIVAGLPIGHGNVNTAVPLGQTATLDASDGSLIFDA